MNETPYEAARDRIAEHDIVFALFALNDYKGMVAALRTLMDEHMRPLVKREKLMTDAERERARQENADVVAAIQAAARGPQWREE